MMLKPIKNNRNFSTYVELLTFLWLRWINNHDLITIAYLILNEEKQD